MSLYAQLCLFQVKTKSYLPPELPELGQIQIRVTAVGDDGLIYMRTQNAGSVFIYSYISASKDETRFTPKSFLTVLVSLSERQFEQLAETVRERIKTLPRPKCYDWKSVQGCAVMGADVLWYRGEVLEVLGEFVKVSATLTPPYNIGRLPCCQCMVSCSLLPSAWLLPGTACGLRPGREHPSHTRLPCAAL